MAERLRYVIRDGMQADVPGCLALDADYETDQVWQMGFSPGQEERGVSFRVERLPRAMTVMYPVSERRLQLALPAEQGFLVAADKDENEVFGYLALHTDPVHRRALVQDLVVGRPYRRSGIGSRLLAVARRWATEHDLDQLTVETQTKNVPAITFFQEQGLVFCGYDDQYFRNGDIAVFFGRRLR